MIISNNPIITKIIIIIIIITTTTTNIIITIITTTTTTTTTTIISYFQGWDLLPNSMSSTPISPICLLSQNPYHPTACSCK